MTATGDATARADAVRTFDRPVVVLAGAGTGKTTLLTERVLFAILGEGMAPREVVAVTFTEKAAAEMSARIERAMVRAAARAPDGRGSGDAGVVARIAAHRDVGEATIRARAREVLPRLGEIRVSTIHHFCGSLLREAGLEGGALPGSRIGTEAIARTTFERDWRAFLEEELGSGGARADAWRECLGRFDVTEIEQAAWSLAPAWVPLDAPVRGGGEQLRAEAAEVVARAASVLAHAEAGAMNRNCRDLLVDGIAQIRRFLEAGRCGPWAERTPAAGSKLSPAFREEVSAARDLVRRLVRQLVTVDEQALEDLVALLVPFLSRFREQTARAGLLTFDDLLHGAARLLAADEGLRARIAGGIGALLVDEFQDTDPSQIEVMLALAEGEHAKKLFVVGDPKQSIYRFRGADIEAYEAAIEELVTRRGALTLSLTTNFRSSPEIVRTVNLIGGSLLTAKPPFQARYEDITPHRAASDGPAVEVWTVRSDPHATARRRAEADAIAEGISASHGRSGRPWKDHAILFRAMTGSLPFVRALRERGIPYVVVGGTDFYRREEIVQGLALLRALAAPSDQVALLAALRSPRCAVPDAEIAGALAGSRFSFQALSASDPSRYAALHRALRFLAAERTRCLALPPDEAARRVLLGPAAVGLAAASFEGAQRVVNLEKLLQRAVDHVGAGERNLVALVGRLELEAKYQVREEESPLADESLDVVRLYTVHKAKGLQFPVVYIPEMFRTEAPSRAAGADASRGIVRGSGGRRLLRLCVAGTRNLAELAWWRANELHEAAEFDRLLYVAMTRPMHRLVFVCSQGRNLAGSWASALRVIGGYSPEQPPGDAVLLAEETVVHRIVEPRGTRNAREPDRAADQAVVRAVARHQEVGARAAASLRPQPRPPSRAEVTGEDREGRRGAGEKGGQGLLFDLRDETRPRSGAAAAPGAPEQPAVDELIEYADLLEAGPLRAATPEQAAALALGTTVHRYLETADLSSALLDLPALERLAREAATEAAIAPDGPLLEARRMLERFLSSPLCAELASAEVLGREVPLLFPEDRRTSWRGTVDLVLRERGRIVVADYKTDRIDPAAARRRAASYAPQLSIYAEGVRRALGLDVAPRRRLIFLAPCIAVDLPVSVT